MSYTVSRQLQWPDGTSVVEVSQGGIDYTNPDALVEHYAGEFQTYDDPAEAAQTAIAICRQWRKDGTPRARVAHGATGGMTMPFEPCSFRDLQAWANKLKDSLPKCDRCGDLLPERHYWNSDSLDDGKFCSEYCAEEAGRVALEI